MSRNFELFAKCDARYNPCRWSLIAGRLPGRTDNEIKNYWNTHLSKKLSSVNQSSTTENHEIRSKSSPLVQNHVLVTTAMSESEIGISNGFNGNSHPGSKSCKIKATIMNSSDLPVSDLITHDDSKSIAKEGVNPTCSMSTVVECRATSHSELLAGDAATLTESEFDLNDLSSPDYNFFSSTSEFCTGFGLEEFYTQSATLAAEAIQFEVTCSDESNMRCFDQGMDDFYASKKNLDGIDELDYIQNQVHNH